MKSSIKLEDLFSLIPERDLDIYFCWGERSTNDTVAKLIQKDSNTVFAVNKAAERHRLAFKFGLSPDSFKFIKKDVVPEGDGTLVLFNFEEINLVSAFKTINYSDWKKVIIVFNLYEDPTDD